MEIILKEDVINLGYKNDIVKVKNGYGRNFLIPTGKAIVATPSAKKALAEELKQRAHKLAKIKADAEELAAKLAPVSLTIATKVSATGAIYGSVGSIQIAEELAKLGFEIDRKIISVESAKEIGSTERFQLRSLLRWLLKRLLNNQPFTYEIARLSFKGSLAFFFSIAEQNIINDCLYNVNECNKDYIGYYFFLIIQFPERLPVVITRGRFFLFTSFKHATRKKILCQ